MNDNLLREAYQAFNARDIDAVRLFCIQMSPRQIAWRVGMCMDMIKSAITGAANGV